MPNYVIVSDSSRSMRSFAKIIITVVFSLSKIKSTNKLPKPPPFRYTPLSLSNLNAKPEMRKLALTS
jgi:hypothetical protein